MELTEYIRLIRRWLWLILIAAFIGGGVSFIVNSQQPAIYEAQATISIGRFIEARNPDQADIRIGVELARTYAQLLRTTNILQSTIDTLGLSMNRDQLERLISTRILDGTSLLVINVTYNDAILAADIANSLAQQLILQSPSNLTPDQQAQIDFASAQIAALTLQIEDARTELELISTRLDNAVTETARQSLVDQRNALIDQINQATATIAQFTDTISLLQQNSNALDIVEEARIPNSTRNSSRLSAVLLGAMTGAGLALGGVLAYEYLDETIRTTEEAAQILTLPVLGAIVKMGKKDEPYHQRLITNFPPTSPVAEGYRTIRTNLLYNAKQSGTPVYIVSSPGPAEGKSITAANLAVALAQADLQVLLIDADLRRPRLHEIFELENNFGLTTLLSMELDDKEGDDGEGDAQASVIPVLNVLQFPSVPKLWVMTSGFVSPNPAEMLGSPQLEHWVNFFRSSLDIDVIIIDTPPALVVADSSILAATTGAEIVMVVDCGHTRYAGAQKAKQQYEQLGIKIKGVVVNRIDRRDQSYEYGYNYTYYYNTPLASQNGKDMSKELEKHKK